MAISEVYPVEEGDYGNFIVRVAETDETGKEKICAYSYDSAQKAQIEYHNFCVKHQEELANSEADFASLSASMEDGVLDGEVSDETLAELEAIRLAYL